MSPKNHTIKVLNFSNSETVSYPLIKIIGTIQTDANLTCQNSNAKTVQLTVQDRSFNTRLLNDKFKFLVELGKGENKLKFEYCCEILEINVGYASVKSDFAVIPLYVICEGHDGRFQAPHWEDNSIESACRRISLCSKLLQCVTAEKLYEHDLGRKVFQLQSECQVFRSKLNYLEARCMDQVELWKVIGREILTSPMGCETKKYLAFLSCTKYRGDKYTDNVKTHEDLVQITEGYVALGGGGLALFGTACLYTWPERFEDIVSRFVDEREVNRSQFLDDSCYRGTLGACCSTTLGSVLHELYHTFDLGHTREGIMGRGFDNLYKVFIETNSSDKNKNQEKPRTYQDKIEFREEFEPESLLQRLLNENRKKEFTVIKKFEEVDDTVLTKSCAVLLCYHRWFNQTSTKPDSVLSFDTTNRLVKSTAGIRLVEIRSLGSEDVLRSWVFVGRVLKFSFQIPEGMLEDEKCDGVTKVVVIEDSAGSIVKADINS